MEIYQLSRKFPPEEKFSLTDQIRRSSRNVCVNIGEGYRKRRYPAHFISKLTDADAENTETEIWLDFALACAYLSREEYQLLTQKVSDTGRLLGYMLSNPDKFS